MIERKIIILVEPGTVREKCNTYEFHQDFIGLTTTDYIIIDPVFTESIYHHLRNQAVAKHPILFDWITKLSVDWDHAAYIRDKLISEGQGANWERNEEILWEIHDPRMAKFKIAKTDRLITSVSGLQSEYRAALRIDGKPLAELDVKNSIPFLAIGLFNLAVLIEQGLYDDILKFNPRLKNRGTRLILFTTMTTTGEAVVLEYNVPSLILTEIACEIDKYPDVLTYIQKVTDGSFYDYMAWYMDGASDGRWYDKPDIRKFAKKGINKAINGQEFVNPYELQIFSFVFPLVAKAFRELQEGFYKTTHGKGNAKWKYGDQVSTYAYVMQRFEARILLETICGRIIRERPEVPLITIHDSIYTLPEFTEYVHGVMVTEIQKVIGHKPMIAFSDYLNEFEEFESCRNSQTQPKSTK